ncbi:MAG: hypothetical protein HC877_24415 [Thioploca sp.]|nr:hypothetical protein [Thioploca sp.]
MTDTHNEAQILSPLTLEEWSHLVQQWQQKEDELTKLARTTRIPREERRPREIELANLLGKLDKEYFDRLPRLPLSRCPYCRELLIRQFDPLA